jgi:hypothetical protein
MDQRQLQVLQAESLATALNNLVQREAMPEIPPSPQMTDKK